MSLLGVNGTLAAAYHYANRTQKTGTGKTSFTEQLQETGETGNAKELSETEEMEIFKKEFYEELSQVINHRTVSNAAINISEAAFKAMKDDPQYKEKVLSLIQRDWGGFLCTEENCSVLITIGATLNEYRADSWPVGYDSEFDVCSKNSFYNRTSEKKNRQKELLEEYLEKQVQMKKQQQEILNEKIAANEKYLDSQRKSLPSNGAEGGIMAVKKNNTSVESGCIN